MEEHIWFLVEKFISGEASGAEQRELQQLLAVYPELYVSVKEFLSTYKDPEPQITQAQVNHFLTEVDYLIADATPVKNHLYKTKKIPYNTVTAWPAPTRTQNLINKLQSELTMAGHFFKIAIRNLQRNRAISLINIVGLAVGIASAIVILIWVQNQVSYDQFHQNKDRVVRLYNRAKVDGEMQAWRVTPIPLGPTLKANYPQVEDFARLNWIGAFVLKNGDKKLETAGYATDPGFFKIFSFPLIEGNAGQALSGVHNIVLTQKLAKKLFGNANAMGKIVKVDSTANFTVTGVLQDLPNNTMLNFEYLVPWSYMKEVGWDNNEWKNHSVDTYALLKPGVTLAAADKAFKNIYKQHNGEQNEEVFVHPMAKWWLYSNSENGQLVAGHIVIVRLFMIIAAFIMIIACINYMNLGTARSTRRAKEVGIRKVSGAGKEWLIKQFLGESVLIAFVSGAIGLALVWLSLPWFNSVIGKELVIPYTKSHFLVNRHWFHFIYRHYIG
ncbi:ABC transporter permease [Mucilaginibacter terrae]|uniref:ABC-type lipoprotein release transport system permease subunit n=1 Tax=Mucilaginibacter terrae TaxID=1955052 RepID=A0ABU3GW79_9SPHI|nr:ABC transporter permease [Mucilaginibacter terrae]MDT3404026.1 ABC-type lipoprotein release transport system permease subunit [Mucilaginibacter terrae]